MSNVANAPTAGRYTTRKFFEYNTSVDLKGSPADIVSWPVKEAKIKILGVGCHLMSATTTITTPPEVNLDKTLAGTSTRAQIGVDVTVESDTAVNTKVFTDFDAGADLDAYSGLRGPEDYPTAVEGDLLTLELAVAGVGGTQSARLWVEYVEAVV